MESEGLIPEKSYFKLNEVCELTGIRPYILRFWESEFEEITPIVSSSGQKLYEHKDIHALQMIKKLLYEEKLTVPKAKVEIKNLLQQNLAPLPADALPQEAPVEISPVQNPQWSPLILQENGIQKLILAKAKLEGIISLAESIKSEHHWH
jgi:DNA-binding transcriptional MerR regulator